MRPIPDLSALEGFAGNCADAVGSDPAVVHLAGPLGVGKTTFVRFWLAHLGLRDTVRSPSFTLLECYDHGDLKIVHTDLFRLRGARELENLGLRDCVGEALLFIEWPERGGWATPPADLHCAFAYADHGRRVAVTTPCLSYAHALGLSQAD